MTIALPDEVRLFPPIRHPYYIVAPEYSEQSAGIKALHLLCHTLNRLGQAAFLVKAHDSEICLYKHMRVNPDLLTPILSKSIATEHFKAARTPIAVYPEVVSGNPLDAPLVVRYVMNFPGFLGGDTHYHPDEFVIAYSAVLAKAVGVGPERVLFIPASNTNVFYPTEDEAARRGSCFYAAKYQKIHNGKLFDVTQNSIEIKLGPTAQTPEQIAELFRKSEVFYAYENTALAIEAMLCGCPTVFLPNQHLEKVIAAEELGWDGFAWGTDSAEVFRAKETVGRGYRNYAHLYERFWRQLAGFVSQTQAQAKTIPYPKRLDAILFARLLVQAKRFGIFRKRQRVFTLIVCILLVVAAFYAGRLSV